MNTWLRVTNPDAIARATDLVHGAWLDADSITFDPKTSTLSIRYLRAIEAKSSFVSRIRFPAAECFLKISKVKSYSVKDTEKIRFYDISTLTFDLASMCVKVNTGVPIEICAIVSALDLTVDETENIVLQCLCSE